MMKIAVVDSQGGGMGKQLIEGVRAAFGESVYILALGTNALAASTMLKAGANDAASGENAVVVGSARVDCILGSAAILCADAMLGELTPAMAAAIGRSAARKLLVPLNRCNLYFAGAALPLGECVADIVKELKRVNIQA